MPDGAEPIQSRLPGCPDVASRRAPSHSGQSRYRRRPDLDWRLPYYLITLKRDASQLALGGFMCDY
jgi:hypothetical protein